MSGRAPRRKGDKTARTKQVAKPYELKPEERAAVEVMLARKKELPVAPRVKVSLKEGGVLVLAYEHKDLNTAEALLMGATGTVYESFFDGLLRQLGNAAMQDGKVSEGDLNFMLAVIKGIEPQDQIESMLAAQMAAVHMATMTFARRLAHVETLPQQDSAERAFNKLARTFTAQIEALKRYRTGGEQRMTVEHVHVHQGGQAIVGTVNQGGRGTSETRDQGHAKAITHAPGTTLRSADPEGDAVPVAGGERPEAVPHARRR